MKPKIQIFEPKINPTMKFDGISCNFFVHNEP